MILAQFIFGLIIHYFINLACLKKKFLINDSSYSEHKKLINDSQNVVLTGGLFFILFFILFSIFDINLILFIFLIFLIGIFSDLKVINNPNLRLILQSLIVFIFIKNLELGIYFTDLKYLDYILEYKYVGLFFSTFCILVLINGSNFIDGLNSLLIVYYILVLLSIIGLTKYHLIIFDLNYIINLTLILSVILIFNLLNKSFLGDSGAYSISCLVGYLSINYFKTVQDLSVLFVVIILWYPAFETLFSIIRKLIYKSGPSSPDNKHLHHKLFKFILSKTKKKYLSNILAACSINLYNFVIFFIAIIYYQNSIFLSFILSVNIITYLIMYKKLKG